MSKATIEIDQSQLLHALEQLPQVELKKIIDTLFMKRLIRKPNFEEVAIKTRKIVEKRRLTPDVVEEAVQWARKQK
jgi:hypothetical protein